MKQQGCCKDYPWARQLDAVIGKKIALSEKDLKSDHIGISRYKKNRYPAARNL
jgi:hypothetical protein